MLGLFRKKIFVNNIFLLGYTFLLYYPLLWHGVDPNFLSEGVLSELMNGIAQSSILVYILTTLVVLAQALMINEITSKHRLDEVNSMFPGMTYVLFLAIFHNGTILNSSLIANFFVILSLSNIVDFYKEKDDSTKTFNAGFFIAIASLINAAYSPLLVFPIFTLFGFRKTDFQETLQIFTGLIVPFLVMWCLTYIFEIDYKWISDQWQPGLELPVNNLQETIQIGFYALCLVVVLLMQNAFLAGMNIHAKNKNGGLYYYFIFAIAGLLLFSGIDTDNLLIITPVLAYFFSIIFIKTRPALGELIHLLLIGFLIYMHFLM